MVSTSLIGKSCTVTTNFVCHKLQFTELNETKMIDRIEMHFLCLCAVLVAALAHQNDFDVCWAKGSVSELLFDPLVRTLPHISCLY